MSGQSKQLRVLRLLHAHRYLDVAQVLALGFDDASLRACQACLTKLHRKSLVVRFGLQRGGLRGGHTSYVYALSKSGAEVLAEATGTPLVDILWADDPETAQGVFVNHQLAANRCLVALDGVIRATPGCRLLRWNSDPHSRLRYLPQGGRRWRVVHPDAIACVRQDGHDFWAFVEIDRGTQEIHRYAQKTVRYARFLLSRTWHQRYPRFPEVRVVSTDRFRAAKLREAAADAIDGFGGDEHEALRAQLYVATTAEPDFLKDPLGPIWWPAFAARDHREP